MQPVVDYLNGVPLAGLMLVVTLGYLTGRISFRGVDIGPAGGTLVVALLLGHFGLSLHDLYGETVPPVTVGLFGFSLFIYSIGFEAGPRFFASLRGRTGWRFVVVGVVVNVVAVLAAWGAGTVLGLDASTTAGTLSGALTSAPAYAAASEIAPDHARLSVSFALAYPVGLVGVVVMIQALPRMLRRTPAPPPVEPHEAEETTLRTSRAPLTPEHGSPELTRVFRVEHDRAIGTPLRELDLTHTTGCVISRIHRGSQLVVPQADTELHRGDHLRVTGRIDELRIFERVVGPEVFDRLVGLELPSRRVQVTNEDAIGKTLAELDLIARHQVVVDRIESGGMLIEPTADATLQQDDVVDVVGESEGLEAVTRELGRREPSGSYTNIAIYAGGILLGLLIGSLELHVGGAPISMGFAGGLLLTGVLLGRFRRMGPYSAHVPRPARQLARDLGILLFVGETGLNAGERLVHGATDAMWQTLVGSALVILLSLGVAFAVGRWLFRMESADTLGSVCGGLTSSSALVVLKRSYGTNEPAVSFAAAYAVASVLVTVTGQVIVGLM